MSQVTPGIASVVRYTFNPSIAYHTSVQVRSHIGRHSRTARTIRRMIAAGRLRAYRSAPTCSRWTCGR
jgi:hypothetical protein